MTFNITVNNGEITKVKIALSPAILLLGTSKRIENIVHTNNLYMNVHNSIIHNSQNVEIT